MLNVYLYNAGKIALHGLLPPDVQNAVFALFDACNFLWQKNISKAELEEIHALAQDIGQNLFSGGEKGKRKEDTALIFESLKDVILEIKKEHGGIEVADILKEKRTELVGGVESGYFSTTRTGLTKEYYQNTSYTTV